MLGTRLSHFTIIERLGSGGMGVVYRAHDERLERDVALKVLPEGSLDKPDARRRFQREALAASRVVHPNVGTVFEFGSEGGADFLVMELVPGESVERRIARAPLEPAEIVRYGVQIAEALATLHENGVLHCDLKPGNVVITPAGQAKVLDFGLARSLRALDATLSMTASDATRIAGTPAYMAPEQIEGRTLDERTDVYALGAMLYAMSTGLPPHPETEPPALMYAILNRPPASPRSRRPEVTAALESIILRALEKSRERRFASARAIAAALRALESGSVATRTTADPTTSSPGFGPRIESLVVLPLTNLSADPEQEFFADGMTEALIANLSRLHALRVISRTSAMLYKNVRKPLPEIARELRVDAVVEGSVARAGGRVRITASLVDGASDRHLWTRSYERPHQDVLALQSEVAQAIAQEIQVRVTPSESARIGATGAVPPDAYETYLRGRQLWNRRTPANVQRALALFQQAAVRAPDMALAHAGIADAYGILADLNAIPIEEARDHAIEAANRALDLDPDLAEAHTSLGFVHTFFTWDWEAADASFRRAIASQPGYATAHQWYAEFLATRVAFDRAEEEARRALELDPHSLAMRTTLADVLYFARRYDGAAALLRETLDLDTDFVAANNDLARVLTQLGRPEEAFPFYERAAKNSVGDPDRSPGLAHAHAVAGHADEARRRLVILEPLARERRERPHGIAVIHTALGDIERAFEWLAISLEAKDRGLVWARINPRVDALRSDPRFGRLLRTMRLE